MKPHFHPKLILLGGGGPCAACIDVIEAEDKYEIVGIVDNDITVDQVCGYPWLGNDDVLSSLSSGVDYALVTVGQIHDPDIRARLFELISTLGFHAPTIISPRAYVSKYAQVGKGSIVMHDALINARAVIGHNCIINSKALIEHDVIVEDHCHISTGAIVNGGAHIKRRSFVGSNSTTIEQVVSGESDFIKAGSLFKGKEHE